MKPIPPAALLAALALLAASCSGEGEKAPGPPKKEEASAPAPAESGGGGLGSLKAAMDRQEERGSPPAEAPAPAAAPAGPAPGPAIPAAGSGGPAAPPDSPAPEGPAAPGVPSDISDTEVLMTWSEDEREALNEMSAEERAEEMEKRRLQVFKDRGGILDDSSVKMGGGAVDAETGMRGPARPDVVRAADLPPADLAQILRDLGSRDPEIRAGGVEAARRFPDQAVASRHVQKLLADPDVDLRAIAANVLGSLAQGSSVEPLVKLLEKGDKDQVRSMAIHALRDIGGREAVGALARMVRDSTEPADRSAALGMLADMKETGEVRGVLGKAFDDLAPEVRQTACIVVRTLDIGDFNKEMMGLLEDYSDNVIIDAIRSLGAMKARAAVGPLVKVLLKPDPESENPQGIQDAANGALETITGVKQGYSDQLTDEQRLAAIDGWKAWWQKNREKW